MIAFWWSELKLKAALIGAALLGVLVAVLKIRKSGRDAERVDNLKATIKSIEKKNEVASETNRLPDGAASDRLRDKWSRD